MQRLHVADGHKPEACNGIALNIAVMHQKVKYFLQFNHLNDTQHHHK